MRYTIECSTKVNVSNNYWLSILVSHLLSSLSILSLSLKITYLSSLISYRHFRLEWRYRTYDWNFQSSVPLYWPVSSECSRKPNSAVVPSPLQLHKSGTKYLLSLELHQQWTVSNITLKPIISPFHEMSTHAIDCPHLRYKSILSAGALTNLLHFIKLQSLSQLK